MSSPLHRFFGGSPLGVLVRLAILSLIVGVVLSAVGFDPYNIWSSLERLVERSYQALHDLLAWGWRYFLLGAVIVFPLWLILRLLKLLGGRG